MELDGLPQLTCLWNKDPHGILSLQILQYLIIKKCSLLRNLFTYSTAMALQQLKVLYLESCPVMEEVIAATEDGLKEVIDDVIEFPKLEWLILKDLPNLNSFLRMSQIFVSTHGNDGLQTEDLNKYLKEQLLLKGEECATVDENDHYGDEERFSNLIRLKAIGYALRVLRFTVGWQPCLGHSPDLNRFHYHIFLPISLCGDFLLCSLVSQCYFITS
ncbi:hypothetical protein TEA_009320 [Camellia sinensis var. sinensis]|uniref:Disease resistance protein At4g27190-like leucine-rich repeats domain-containing protein n=1 Tax=Camellia sinensis var. sinensis TaxID=542762 RepID=A0A4S4D567_CAMSN|nr:hypothetical protein TEA_009320 [Camellia sinensis var. sinensis]